MFRADGTSNWLSFLRQDISLRSKSKPRVLAIKKQVKIIQLFNNLLGSGFNLPETVDFLKRSQLIPDKQIQIMHETLLNGFGLPILMKNLGFSDAVVTQLSLAETHGNSQKSMTKIESYLRQVGLMRKKLIEVATYPIILLLFLLLIMLGLKNYLLPQLEEGNVATTLLEHFPLVFLLGMVTLVCLSFLAVYLGKRMEQIRLYRFLSSIPFVGYLIKLYLTAYYAREWGNLLGQGVEMTRIVSLMQEQESRLFSSIGRDMQAALLSGQSFHAKVLDYPFFLKELSLIIEYGNAKGHLGQELDVFSEELWEQFFYRLNRAMQLIQPLIFILVALMIVMIYAAMLLPMYQSMEVM
ncbi:competence type IV pilus assembly protein ComGB [Streptococcus thoraltensis]|uniref:competence type IV pilus assembly protein ComGB n=1 Tax=Streptococcus thoraltensis TaxID=55085 RepID=UPI000A041AA5|nr:competence type IV pilus assembly protein ComGB [Streptococcus thoraltensis]MDY4761784.1 competence type IV pilus assembly protein ComGB [Streptococcus thoraltensis]